MTEDIDLIRVTGVEYVKGYTMRLEFSNGKVKPPEFRPVRAHSLGARMVQWGRFRSGLLVQEWGGGVTGTNTNETLMDFFSKYRPGIIALCEKHIDLWITSRKSI